MSSVRSESLLLAPYAQHAETTRGRRHPEPEHAYRSAYQRDRDRIIHSRAFRRLEYKTQVFVNHEGDHYRTRLTHSIEVSQIGRTVARAMQLNEDLVESLALSHDLGHTPFGHLGEEVLNELLSGHGGFDHNRQTLRIVEWLEDRYASFSGLNLTWEVREGIAKHSGSIDVTSSPELSAYEPRLQPPLEAQMIDLVDEIAYNHHDIDDGLESGLLEIEPLAHEVALFGDHLSRARRDYPRASSRQIRTAALRGVIDELVSDLIEVTQRNISDNDIDDLEAVRRSGCRLVSLSPRLAKRNAELKVYLRRHLYGHQRIERMKDKARRILRALFERYHSNTRLLPQDTRRKGRDDSLERTIADYIAGMTDRYAIEEYRRLFDPSVRV
jgi:dGTPase